MSKRVHDSLQQVRAAEVAVHDALLVDYPVGGDIKWRRGGYGKLFYGEVMKHSHGDRVNVLNHCTGAEYWIHAYCIEPF